MLIDPRGSLVGTVGGGCVEADVIGATAAAHAHGPQLLTHHLNADVAGDLGLSCGGTVEIVVEPLVAAAEYVQVLEQVAASLAGVLVTGLDWSAGPVKRFAPQAVGAGAAAELSEDRRTLIERLLPAPRVIVFGAGHVGRAIALAAATAGFQVLILDDRPEFADPARFPERISVSAVPAHDTLERLAISTTDAVVIATRGHRHDRVVRRHGADADALILERVAPSSAGYIGLLGSRRKKSVVTKALVRAGVPTEALERVRVPVGLAIGAVTPEEIAVSVVAELIAWRRGVAMA
jgi:xanthine dehydrogenase accessory factor